MRIKKTLTTNCPFILAALGFLGGVGPAQVPKSQPVDVVLALDNSGSMKRNDPNGLVTQAVVDFAGRLPAGSQLGIVIFDQRVDLALNLTKVADPQFQSLLAQSLKRVNYSGKWTDIPGGIERATYTLNHDGRPDARHAVVFFTDGIVETGDAARDLDRSKWLRENLAVDAKEHGIRIFGVAFTESADYQLIETVSQITAGEHYRVLKSSDVAEAFARISKQVLEPPPTSANMVSIPVAAQEPWYARVTFWSLLVVVALAVVLSIVWLRRGRVPSVHFAHLVDVGRHSGAERIPIRKRSISIGRDPKSDISIAEKTVTSRHASIEYRDGHYFLRDLRSVNGTYVNKQRISDPDAIREVLLKAGDHIRFDAYEFIFNLDGASTNAQSEGAEAPVFQRTVLRRDGPPSGQERPKSAAKPEANAAPAPTIQKPAPSPNAPVGTVVKNEFCPTHSSWKATELCVKCGVGKCRQCMVENSAPQVCLSCANAGRNLT